jgi:excisionase family DNA binding protein
MSDPTDEGRDAYRTEEAAKRLGISYDTLMRLIRAGKLGAVTTGKRYVVPAQEIQRFLAPAVKTETTA